MEMRRKAPEGNGSDGPGMGKTRMTATYFHDCWIVYSWTPISYLLGAQHK